MKKWIFCFIIGLLFLGIGWKIQLIPTPMHSEAQTSINTIVNSNSYFLDELQLKIHDVPKSFHEGYVSLLSKFISASKEIEFPPESTNNDIITNATQPEQTTEEETPAQPSTDYVQYDSKHKILTVLAAPEEQEEIRRFLQKLEKKVNRESAVLYRMALLERDVHPKLKDYPYQFWIKGTCWDDGRNRHKYPKWMDDRKKDFPHILFAEIDIERDDDETKFKIEGYAQNKNDVEQIFKHVRQHKDTDSDTKMVEHDFMKESYQNLHNSLLEVFPDFQLKPIINTLQKTKVYHVETEATLSSESAIPGFFQTTLGDGFSVKVECKEGLEDDHRFNIEIFVYKNDKDKKTCFDEKSLHLATSLLTKFGQINMLGLRDQEERYVLLFSMEQMPSK